MPPDPRAASEQGADDTGSYRRTPDETPCTMARCVDLFRQRARWSTLVVRDEGTSRQAGPSNRTAREHGLLSGEILTFTGTWPSWASPCRSGPCRDSWDDAQDPYVRVRPLTRIEQSRPAQNRVGGDDRGGLAQQRSTQPVPAHGERRRSSSLNCKRRPRNRLRRIRFLSIR
jgi:hypothetical protein